MADKREKIRLALPIGSLNHARRGNTCDIIKRAGYAIRGYEPGAESPKPVIENHPEIELSIGRPQDFPLKLSEGQCDIAIMGRDWFEEIRSHGVRLVGDLGYGKVKIVAAVLKSAQYKSVDEFISRNCHDIELYTEYPNLAKRWFMRKPQYARLFSKAAPVIVMHGYKTASKNLAIRIIETAGQTESFVERKNQMIVENTQTGETLKKYGLVELEEIMFSEAGLYRGPSCTDAKQKRAKEIYEMLKGAVAAPHYLDIWLNVPDSKVTDIINYAKGNGLCISEPTVIRPQLGQEYASVHILAPEENWSKYGYGLKRLGASGLAITTPRQVIE